MSRRKVVLGAAAALAMATAGSALPAFADAQGTTNTTTPIQHLVVIYQENVSFDHYFGTYPQAANTDGSRFVAASGTPSVNGLGVPYSAPNNPNSAQPFRFSHSEYELCSQDHGYTSEQKAFDSGLMDRFPESTDHGVDSDGTSCSTKPGDQVMGYYDGNTVTGLWNYAQHYAMSDNSFSTNFGPSTVGAINLVSGQTHGFSPDLNPTTGVTGTAVTPNQTIIGDPQPAGDKCDTRDQSTQLANSTDKNIGDLLNEQKVSWGWFQGGFDNCTATHTNMGGVTSADYIPHHEPFQYYRSTQNLQHLQPTSTAMIGKQGDQANHQYDLTKWDTALQSGNLPQVSFLKAAGYQDGHAGYSDPLDEQNFLVNTINKLQKSQYWKNTAVVIAYDDSDGWYDHQMSPIVNQSSDPATDALRTTVDSTTGAVTTDCGTSTAPNAKLGGYQDRCGYGPRQPLLVISPFARSNYVDHTITDQTSILRFIEDNWKTGKIGDASMDVKANSLVNMFDFGPGGQGHGAGPGQYQLNPTTGQPVASGQGNGTGH